MNMTKIINISGWILLALTTETSYFSGIQDMVVGQGEESNLSLKDFHRKSYLVH